MPDGNNSDLPVYEVRLSEPAEAEIDVLYLRISAVSPEFAARWHEGLLAAFMSLTQLPRRCGLAAESSKTSYELRQLLYRRGCTTYRILFAVFESDDSVSGVVRVLHIRNAAQRRLHEAGDDST